MPDSFTRKVARLYGILWILADLVNAWKFFQAVATKENPYERAAYAGVGLVIIPVVFYCAFQLLALTKRIPLSLNILLVVSFLPIPLHGFVPLEILAWVVLGLLPSRWLIKSFSSKSRSRAVAASGTQI